jgi:hypothetical protein
MCAVPVMRTVCRESRNEPRRFFLHEEATRQLPGDFELFEGASPALEMHDGHMPKRAHRNASFLADFAERAEVGGSDLTRDVFSIGSSMVLESPCALPLTVLGVAVPLAVPGNYVVESLSSRGRMRALRVSAVAIMPMAEAA